MCRAVFYGVRRQSAAATPLSAGRLACIQSGVAAALCRRTPQAIPMTDNSNRTPLGGNRIATRLQSGYAVDSIYP